MRSTTRLFSRSSAARPAHPLAGLLLAGACLAASVSDALGQEAGRQDACAALWTLDRMVVASAIGAGTETETAEAAARKKIAAAYLDDPSFRRLRSLAERDLPLAAAVPAVAQEAEAVILARETADYRPALTRLAGLVDRRDLAASAALLGCRGGERPVVTAAALDDAEEDGGVILPGSAAALAAAAAALATGSFMGRRKIGYAWRCLEDDKADRAPVEKPVVLFLGGQKLPAVLTESSRHGGRVRIEPPLAEGTPLVMAMGRTRVQARVRWSTPTGGDLLYLQPLEAWPLSA